MWQGCHKVHHSPLTPIATALSQQSILAISLTDGTGCDSHPPEVKFDKVVSDLLRGVDVFFAKMSGNALFPDTQENYSWCSPQTPSRVHPWIALQGNLLGLNW